MQGLDDNDLLNHDVVLNGYTRNIDVLFAIKDTVQRVRKNNPNAIYICDPVLGDNGQFYVPEALLDAYKNHLIPLAHVITPNYFEVEVLTGMKVKCIEDAVKASAMLHDLGATIVLMTGQRLSGEISEISEENDNDTSPLSILLSTRWGGVTGNTHSAAAAETTGESETEKHTNHVHSMLRIEVPRIPGYFHGCGDLLSALCANGIFRAVGLSGGSMAAIQANADDNIAVFQKHLALMLDHSAWAMTNIVADTYHMGTRELHIVESAHIYQKIKDDWRQVCDTKIGIGAQASTARAFTSFLDREQKVIANEASKFVTIQPAYSALPVGKERVQGVIFDMDGTLTMPGLINFAAMTERCGLTKQGGSILTQIGAMPEDKRQQALDVIHDEERKGNDNIMIRSELKEFLSVLLTKRVRMALATLNSELSVKHFMNTSGIPANTFNPAVNRDSLGGIMKPDPQVATSILNAWDVKTLTDADTTAGASVGNYWFIGDSLDDMKCGHLAGCKTCLIRTSFNKQVELDQAGTGVITVVVDTLTEWLEHVSL